MALKPQILLPQSNHNSVSLSTSVCFSSFQFQSLYLTNSEYTIVSSEKSSECGVSRRLVLGSIAILASSMVLLPVGKVNGLDMKFIAPDQTVEEAESGIRGHAQALLQVKTFIESEDWREAQKALRSSSPYLKQDLRTIIQYKPAAERPPLRKLYSLLFNGVSRLDYAARDKDKPKVWQCYDDIVEALNDILSRI